MKIGKVVEVGRREPAPPWVPRVFMPCPVTGNDHCTVLSCREQGCALARVREPA